MSRKRTKASIKKNCDKLMGQHIRSRGYCECCNNRDKAQLQWCHIKSRRYLSIRWDELNSLCLCAKCHRWFTDHPDLFTKWIDKLWPDRLDKLNKQFQVIYKMTLEDRLNIERNIKHEMANNKTSS